VDFRSVVEVPAHALSTSMLEAFADGSSGEVGMAMLVRSESSRRRLMLRSIITALRRQSDLPDALWSQDAVWDAIVEADRRCPQELQTLLLCPQVGMWMAHALRCLRGAPADSIPMWMHLGYLNAIAVSAALRSGSDFQTSVPVWRGRAIFPALGYLQLSVDEPWGSVEVACSPSSLQVFADGDVISIPINGEAEIANWHPLLRVAVSANGRGLSVVIDDFDPYREMLTENIWRDPLDAEQRIYWRDTTVAAWEMIARDHPERVGEISTGLLSVTPLQRAARFRPNGASSGDAFGAVLASEPDDPTQLAVGLIHEIQHSKLNALLHLFTFMEPSDELFHAPWRDDPRPLSGLLHGAYSFSAVTEFWDRRRTVDSGRAKDLAHFEFALWKRQTRSCLDALKQRSELNDIGRHFVESMIRRNAQSEALSVPKSLADQARCAAVDHSIAWRTHHVRPDQSSVDAYAQAWTLGDAAPTEFVFSEPDVVEVDPVACNLDGRAVLARKRIVDGDLEVILDDSSDAVSGAIAADFAFLDGNFDAAHDQYLGHLRSGDDRGQVWAGIALTADEPAKSLLFAKPEFVRALRASIRRGAGEVVDPIMLCQWMAGAIAKSG
jgi:HEXXH motif-containing protein